MKKIRAFLAVTLAAVIFVPSATMAVMPDVQVSPSAYPQMFRLWHFSEGNYVLAGSAVAVSDRHIITIYHALGSDGNNDYLQYGTSNYSGNPPANLVPLFGSASGVVVEASPEFPFGTPNWNERVSVATFPPGTFKQWFPIYDGPDSPLTEIGLIVNVLGFGETAIETTSYPFWQTLPNSTGPLRVGNNTISRILLYPDNHSYDNAWVLYDHDYLAPNQTLYDLFGDGGHITGECNVNPGDSGGPSLVLHNGLWKVYGLHQGLLPPPFLGAFRDMRIRWPGIYDWLYPKIYYEDGGLPSFLSH